MIVVRCFLDTKAIKPKFLRRYCSGMSGITTHWKGPFNWIDGKRTDPVEYDTTFDNVEPRTGKILCKVPISGPKEVDRAVHSAKKAFSSWSKLTGFERGRLLTAAGLKMRQYVEEIARLDVIDNGKPIWEARMDMETVIDSLEYYGGLAPSINGHHVKMPGGSFAYVSKEPLGVIGGVGAWNYPLQTATWKVAPALACGNTFVYKPSQFTPLTAVILGEVLKEAGVPDGVFNVIQGEGETGSLLCGHSDCSKLSFTGSVATGTRIMKTAADGIKSVTLELGGKSPLIIFDDADLINAVKGALMANFFTQGEVCSNGTRVFVQSGIYDSFLKEFVRQTQKMKIGDPLCETTTVGATIHRAHAEKVLNYIQSAKDDGATVVTGGTRILLDGELSQGYYLSPCIITNVKDDMKVVKDEIFGSVASILSFESESEVIRRANDTPYGLGGGVFTRDLNKAHRVANSLEAGSIWINTFNIAPATVPFGGFKMSGIGRENGLAAIEHYTQSKTIYVEMNDVDCGQLYQND